MNRKILIQVATPAVVIGLLLFGTCLLSVRYIHRLQTNMANILSENVTGLRAAEQIEISVRRLRFHCFLYLVAPDPVTAAGIDEDHQRLEYWLGYARQSSTTAQEHDYVQEIKEGYTRYRQEFERLSAAVIRTGPRRDFQKLAEAHPVRHIVDPCEGLLRVNEELMEQTSRESQRVTQQAHLAMLLLGLLGPISGVIMGYGVSRGLSRSIYQLSVRVQGLAQHLDEDVASVSVAANGDIHDLDQQLEQVVRRVQEVAERLHRQQREMLRAEQLSAVGQLAASVAHEVRNPLTSVKMLVEAALRPRHCQPLSPEDLHIIHGEIARLEQTVQGLLDFARVPTPQRRVCDLRAVVAQAMELIRVRACQQQVETEVRCREAQVPAYIDRGQLCTVLVNLFLNALDAMPQGGRLKVDLVASPNTGVGLRVADTGAGISEEMLGRLFTPFASTKPTGTGLGLSITRRIIEEHGGRITAGNGPEGGACFTILLPPSSVPTSESHDPRGLDAEVVLAEQSLPARNP